MSRLYKAADAASAPKYLVDHLLKLLQEEEEKQCQLKYISILKSNAN
jgi:hypothetical protein